MIYFIEKMDKPNIFEKIFKNVKIENDTIMITSSKNKTKYCNKVIKLLNSKNVKEVILSKELEKDEELKKVLNSNNVDIDDGRWLFKYIMYEIVTYIINLKKLKKEETEISILTNETSDTSIENIKLFAKQFKRINVVTNHIEKFKKIETYLYDKYGIPITITNNKKKSLLKSKIILNLDFPNELINKFQLMEDAIIINPEGNTKIESKRFNGIIIKNYEISLSKIEEIEHKKVEKYKLNEILEAITYKKDSFINVRKNIKKYGLKIENLLGNNGILIIT